MSCYFHRLRKLRAAVTVKKVKTADVETDVKDTQKPTEGRKKGKVKKDV